MIQVITGFGFILDSNNHVVAKAILPKGEHPIKDGFDYYEVNSQAELDAIEVYQAPKSAEQLLDEKIQEKIRSMAMTELQKEGKL